MVKNIKKDCRKQDNCADNSVKFVIQKQVVV